MSFNRNSETLSVNRINAREKVVTPEIIGPSGTPVLVNGIIPSAQNTQETTESDGTSTFTTEVVQLIFTGTSAVPLTVFPMGSFPAPEGAYSLDVDTVLVSVFGGSVHATRKDHIGFSINAGAILFPNQTEIALSGTPGSDYGTPPIQLSYSAGEVNLALEYRNTNFTYSFKGLCSLKITKIEV